MSVYVVLIACPDRAGLVHEITGLLYRRQVNVTQNQEYVDHGANQFFMRTQFEGTTDTTSLIQELRQLLPPGASYSVQELKPRRLVILVSEEPHCLGDLLLRHVTGELNAEILAVISQHSTCQSLVQRFSLPFHHVPIGPLTRTQHEAQILKVIELYNPELLVLARYMRIFSKEFVAKYPARILNIHHSFLPAFIGRDPYEQAHRRGVKIIGATAHFVTSDLDEGPIITQDVISVDHTDSPAEMARRGQDVEKLVLARALQLTLEDRVLVDGNRTIVFS